IGTPGVFAPDLTLQQGVEVAVDSLRFDAGADISAGRGLDLVEGPVDITRRIGVGDVAGNDRQVRLGRDQARQRGVEGLGEAHAGCRSPKPSVMTATCVASRNRIIVTGSRPAGSASAAFCPAPDWRAGTPRRFFTVS